MGLGPLLGEKISCLVVADGGAGRGPGGPPYWTVIV